MEIGDGNPRGRKDTGVIHVWECHQKRLAASIAQRGQQTGGAGSHCTDGKPGYGCNLETGGVEFHTWRAEMGGLKLFRREVQGRRGGGVC